MDNNITMDNLEDEQHFSVTLSKKEAPLKFANLVPVRVIFTKRF